MFGHSIDTINYEEKEAGIYTVEFKNAGLSSGIYFYSFTAGGFSSIKKFVLMK